MILKITQLLAQIPSVYFPKSAPVRYASSKQGWLHLTQALLAALLTTGAASSTADEPLAAEPAAEAPVADASASPNWQQWQLASQSAEEIVNREVGDSGLLLDAISDNANLDLTLSEAEQTGYGASASWLLRGEPYFIDAITVGARQVGISSWYGPGFHGRLTASGQVFDMHQLTAAHRTLPLPSYIRVTNLGNGRKVIVKVNDRGPYHGNRMLDLSYAAAQALGFQGTAKVSIEAVDGGRTGHLRKGKALEATDVYRVRLGNFSDPDIAHDLESRLLTIMPKGVGIDVISEREPAVTYRVSVGPMLTRAEAELVIRGLRAQRLGMPMALDIRASPQ